MESVSKLRWQYLIQVNKLYQHPPPLDYQIYMSLVFNYIYGCGEGLHFSWQTLLRNQNPCVTQFCQEIKRLEYKRLKYKILTYKPTAFNKICLNQKSRVTRYFVRFNKEWHISTPVIFVLVQKGSFYFKPLSFSFVVFMK